MNNFLAVLAIVALIGMAWGCMWMARRAGIEEGMMAEVVWWWMATVCAAVAVGAMWLVWGKW